MYYIKNSQLQQFQSDLADQSCSQSQQGSPYFENFTREQKYFSQLNSSSSRKNIRTNGNWQQQEIDDFFENFDKYMFIQFGNQNQIKKEYSYKGCLLNIFDQIKIDDSAKKRMRSLINQNKLNSVVTDDKQDSNGLTSQISYNQNSNVIYNHLNTEYNDHPYYQNGQNNLQQFSQQDIRRIRTQSCDTDETKQQQQQFGIKQFPHNIQQQEIYHYINSNQIESNKVKIPRNRPTENPCPGQKQEVTIQKQNNYFESNSIQKQQQNISQQKIQNSNSHNNQKNTNQIVNVNQPLISKQETKPRSITMNVNQASKNSTNNLNSIFNGLYYEVEKENISPNLIQQNNKQMVFGNHENLKKKIENIQNNAQISKTDFINSLYQNIIAIQQDYQGQIQNNDISPLSQSKSLNHQGVQAQQKIQSTLKTLNQNIKINQNAIENPIMKVQTNQTTRGSTSVNQAHNNQINNKNDHFLNKNHLNNKLKVFVGKKPPVDKICNQQIAGQQINQNTLSNYHLTEQLREKMRKQWEINRDSVLVHQQSMINNKTQNRIPQKQFITYTQQQQQQQQVNNSKQVQQQQIPLSNNQQPQVQMQYKYIKRIY